MKDSRRKILELDELQQKRSQLKTKGKTVVQCHGCFDIVHPGHIRYLRFAKQQGDVLVVTLSGDTVVSKGAERPYVVEDLRAENLAALEMVDFVCIDEHTWAGPALDAVRPDIYVKGKEYEENNDARFAKERDLVESYGGQVIFSSGDVVFSSTEIIGLFHERFALEVPKIGAYCRRNEVTRAGVDDAIARLSQYSLAVVGDAIVDHYIHCETSGLAAEAPVLSVTPSGTTSYVGGAGLIALQAAALGAKVRFLTSASSGPSLDMMVNEFEAAGVELVLVDTERRPVAEKTRYLLEDRKVLKVDSGQPGPLATLAQRKLGEETQRAFAECDGVVATDFGFGTFGAHTVEALSIGAKSTRKPLYVDVSQAGDASILKFRGARLATPTESELRFAMGDRGSGLSNLASRFYSTTGIQRLLVTLGKRGVVLFGSPEQARDGRLTTDYLPSLATAVVDPVGAGDVFLAALAMSDLASIPMTLGAYLASAVSGAHLRHLGNGPVSLRRLAALLDSRGELAGSPR